jgi:hypothetical protein
VEGNEGILDEWRRISVRYWNGTGVKKRNMASTGFVNGDCASLGSDFVTIRKVVSILNVRGINDLPAVISLRSARVDVRSAGVDVRDIGLGILVGSDRLVFKEVRWRIRGKVIGSNAENLSRVDVVAVLVDIGVVVVKLGRIDFVRRLNPNTGITWLNNVGVRAVGALRTQADRFLGYQIAAAGVNGGVDDHQLIRWCVVSGTDGVASVPTFDSVGTNAITWGCGNTLSEEWKGSESNNDDRSEHGAVKRVWGAVEGVPTGFVRSQQI